MISDLDVVQAAEESRVCGYVGHSTLDVLQRKFPGCPDKVIYAALERASSRDLIDYGVSIRCSWPSISGKNLLIEASEQHV